VKQVEQLASAFTEHPAIQSLDCSNQGPPIDGGPSASKDASEVLASLDALVL
jgi:hypothetical protein